MRYQEVITLRFFENLEYSQIAQILNKHMGTVKSLIHRGLNRLRKQMDKQNRYVISIQIKFIQWAIVGNEFDDLPQQSQSLFQNTLKRDSRCFANAQ